MSLEKVFSESEVDKLTIYDEVTDKIIESILKYKEDGEEMKIFIEGVFLFK